MNYYIKTQIENIIMLSKNFETACKLAAIEDDGTVTRQEEKELKKISKATSRFIKELENLK